MCRVQWCNKRDRFYKNGKPMSLCSVHIQYKEICHHAIYYEREYLMYKVEQWVKGKHQCEECGYDPTKTYPNETTKAQSGTLDVDHIDSGKKHIFEHENPKNYQLLCKNCHIIKGHKKGDNIRKDYK